MKKAKEQQPFIMLNGARGTDDAPLYRQIYAAIRKAILTGEFAAQTRLPATRALAEQLGVSRITVMGAYEQLFAEGYLEGKIGAGTFVASELPEDLLKTSGAGRSQPTKKTPAKEKKKVSLRLSPFGEKLAAKKNEKEQPQRQQQQSPVGKFEPFQNSLTAVEAFPFEIWARIAGRLNRHPARELLGYGEAQGYAPLREAIAAHLRSARGVRCTPEQVIITSGAQQALDLAARIFLSEEDTVLIEDPCYREARNSLKATGAKVVPIEVDQEGFNLASAAPLDAAQAKLAYVTPSHQYPLGVTMSLARRLALIEWARAAEAWIIEDDYNSEFRYNGRPLASLQGLDESGRVIYVGTFSKTIFPSLRIGCAVVPPELVEIFTLARAMNDVHSSVIDQAILTEFIHEGHFARHVRRMRRLYAERQQILLEECENNLRGLIEVKPADAGMHLVGWLPEGLDGLKLCRQAAALNLNLSSVSAYSTRPPERDGLILGYTGFNREQITAGVKKIKKILESDI